LKYFLSKFFLIPVRDENDPDNHKFGNASDVSNSSAEDQKVAKNFLKKHNFYSETKYGNK
jgi:hypothetical protein